MKNYKEPKLEIISVNILDIIKTSTNQLDDADKYAGSTNYKWN